MKALAFLGVFLFVFGFSVTSSEAQSRSIQDSGWYGSLRGGLVFSHDIDDLDTGGGGAIALGYNAASNTSRDAAFQIEAVIGYAAASGDYVDIETTSFGLNLRYVFMTNEAVSPFIGIGGGGSSGTTDFGRFEISDTVGAFGGGIGMLINPTSSRLRPMIQYGYSVAFVNGNSQASSAVTVGLQVPF